MAEDPLWAAIKRLSWAKAKCRKGKVSAAMIEMLEKRVQEEAAKVIKLLNKLGPDWKKRLGLE